MAWTTCTDLRATFAAALSELYAAEVPLYATLVSVAGQVNREVLARGGAQAERLGTVHRVTAERHGAIRLGTPAELAQAARLFAAFGMHPVGFYDLRDTAETGLPIVATAFRPIGREELARNPFRLFTSLLTPQDQRFFTPQLAARVNAFLQRRSLFPPTTIELADRAAAEDGLPAHLGAELVRAATDVFRFSHEPVDRAWYCELEQISSVAADIAGLSSTHINHLTPRVLDIDDFYRRMLDCNVEMIDTIQGPPGWPGPDVLLRQTSFRALDETRMFNGPDGSVTEGTLRVRFGEVEARGIALTRAGRSAYDGAMAAIDASTAEPTPAGIEGPSPADIWGQYFPATERELHDQGLGVFEYSVVADRKRDGRNPTSDVSQLIDDGFLRVEPVVYEDFLPRSAAGIFQSNLTGNGQRIDSTDGVDLDESWLAGVLHQDLLDPVLHEEQRSSASLTTALASLGVGGGS